MVGVLLLLAKRLCSAGDDDLHQPSLQRGHRGMMRLGFAVMLLHEGEWCRARQFRASLVQHLPSSFGVQYIQIHATMNKYITDSHSQYKMWAKCGMSYMIYLHLLANKPPLDNHPESYRNLTHAASYIYVHRHTYIQSDKAQYPRLGRCC